MDKLLSNEYDGRLRHWIRTLQSDLYIPLEEIEFEGFTTFAYLTPEQAVQKEFRPIRPGTAWGHTWEYMWLKGRIVLPEAAEGRRIVMDLNLSGEATLFVGGEAFGTRRAEWVRTPHHLLSDNILTLSGVPGQAYDLLFEVYAGHYYPEADSVATGPVLPGAFADPKVEGERARVGVSTFGIWNEDAYQLYIDVTLLEQLLEQLPQTDLRAADVARALMQFTHTVDFEQRLEGRLHDYKAARNLLRPVLAARNGTTQADFYAIGNAHLDLAWLWPMQETYRKTARTFAQQLRLLAMYPTYQFLQSQPASYEMCRDNYPALYRRIQDAVKEGRWVAEGAMYVEPDTNMACGEALIRQLLYGKRFFKEEFGVDSTLLWLPDSFGYTAALPQILAGCGVKYLVTQKIFWSYNDGDQFPYHYFYWKGMDGTSVTAFLPTSYTYRTDPEEMCGVWKNRVQTHDLDAFLIPYGYGDGGGGPCRDHIEYALRETDLQGMPKVQFATPMDFFRMMEEKGGPKNTWDGELYFSAHRGTYTTQARTKKNNRRLELLMRQADMWQALAGATRRYAVESEKLTKLWKTLLLHQFHDILPGSSIARVYTEAAEKMEQACAEAEAARDDAQRTWLNPGGVTLFNALSWAREAVVDLPEDFASGAATVEGDIVPVCGGQALVSVPPAGCVSLMPKQSAPSEPTCFASVDQDGFTLRNDVVTIRFDAVGRMTTYQANNGCVWRNARMNEFRMFKDVPRKFDAWDIDSNYRRDEVALGEDARLEIVREKGLSACVRVTRTLNQSKMTQEISLSSGEARVVFDTRVDWHELHRLLKVRFDGGIRSENAIHEIQFGYVERPTHDSREYDRSRFEVCNHHYTALCDNSHGFAVLNDCKYGVSARDGAIELTLLRAAASPEMGTDQGENSFTYAFTAWRGSFMDADVTREGYEINMPVCAQPGHAPTFSAFDVSAPNVVLETIKPAEDQSGDLILRLYECKKAQTDCELSIALPVSRVCVCDMLENEQCDLTAENGRVALHFEPFKIITLRLKIG